MKNLPYVSIIIPTWRENKVLEKCLASIDNLNYPKNKIEVILSSKKRIKIKRKRLKIKNILVPLKSHHAESRNIAVKKAQGTIIAFLDDDCLVPPNWLRKGIKFFKDKKIGLIGGPIPQPKNQPLAYRFGGYIMASPFGTGLGGLRWRIGSKVKEASEIDLILANNLMRKNIFLKVKGFDKDQVPCEENHLYSKILNLQYKILNVPQIYVYHRSKPIFIPIVQKVFFYSTGRGIFVGRFPTNFKLTYIMPSLFLVFFVTSLLNIFFLKNILFGNFVIFTFLWYFFFSSLNSLYIFVKFEKNLLIFLLIPPAILMVHLSYGLGFLHGILRYITNRWQGGILMPTKA